MDGMKTRTLALAAAVVSVSVLGVARAGLLVSEKEVRREERLAWLSMKRHVPVDADPRVQTYVQCVAKDLIAVLPPKERDAEGVDWEIVVFDDDAINASANSQGKIAVYNGLLRVADTPDALAAVLGHEIAHATQNHVMDRQKKGARSDMLVMLGSAATGIDPGVLRDGATIGMTLPYARDQEAQADLIGLQYMAKAGFDPRAAMHLWKSMSAVNKNQPPEFLSDHPADDVRLNNIVKAITPALVSYNKALDAGQRPNCQQP
jgi:predicted Zn-dependent protease